MSKHHLPSRTVPGVFDKTQGRETSGGRWGRVWSEVPLPLATTPPTPTPRPGRGEVGGGERWAAGPGWWGRCESGVNLLFVRGAGNCP